MADGDGGRELSLRKLLAVALLSAAWLSAQIKPAAMGAIAVTVSDLDRSVEFFTKILEFEKESTIEMRAESFDRLTGIFGTNIRVATMRLGTDRVQLVEYISPHGRPMPSPSRSNDGWFQHIAIVVSDMERAFQRLMQNKVPHISTEPQLLPGWNPNAGGIKAFYFRDPDNHALELIWFPAGKGHPRWQGGKTLFLGIDHTAIAVQDTDRSMKFYSELLGLKKVGEALNYGPEQEHLNHVFGSRVRITGLAAPLGPGVEFLEYVAPTDGLPMPADSHPNDIWHWNSTLVVDDLAGTIAELRKTRTRWVTSDAVDAAPLGQPGKKGVFIRDPDGHAVLVLAK